MPGTLEEFRRYVTAVERQLGDNPVQFKANEFEGPDKSLDLPST
jgi:hypothetical protein